MCRRLQCRRQTATVRQTALVPIVCLACAMWCACAGSAGEQSHEPTNCHLHSARALINAHKFDLAREELCRFEVDEMSTASASQVHTYHKMHYLVATAEYRAGPDNPAMRSNYDLRFRQLRDFLLQSAAALSDGNPESSARDLGQYHDLLIHYVGTLQTHGAYEQALKETQRARQVIRDAQPLLSIQSDASVQDASGNLAPKSVSLGERYHIDSPEVLHMRTIASAKLWHAHRPGPQSREALIAAYRGFVNEHRAHRKAAFYLNEAMVLEGKVDLDELIDLHRACEDKKSSQYHGSILGLANLLLNAGRSADALALYQEVDPDQVPSRRLAELHYGMGRAFLAEGDNLGAIRSFQIVKGLTDRYEDVPLLIEQTVGITPEQFYQIVEDTVRSLATLEVDTPSAEAPTDPGPQQGAGLTEGSSSPGLLNTGRGIAAEDDRPKEGSSRLAVMVGLGVLLTGLLVFLVIRANRR